METIYLSLSAQAAVGTFFMKSPVYVGDVGSTPLIQDGGNLSLL